MYKNIDTAKMKALLMDFVIPSVVGVALVTVVGLGLLEFAKIPTQSMKPTIDAPSFVVASRRAYDHAEPQRGDVIIFRHDEISLIKRVIALPNETVSIVDGTVFVNNQPLLEPYIKDTWSGSFDAITLPADGYFVLGDNRNESLDARFWSVPYVTRKNITSQARLQLYPKIKPINGYDA